MRPLRLCLLYFKACKFASEITLPFGALAARGGAGQAKASRLNGKSAGLAGCAVVHKKLTISAAAFSLQVRIMTL